MSTARRPPLHRSAKHPKKTKAPLSRDKSRSKGRSPGERKPIIFAGPSIGASEVLRLVPNADVRRPIRRGDLDEIETGSLVAIIDGVFDAELSVSTREIRLALGRGVRIVGSSSMGALRACEVPQMLGVGRVYEMYRDGRVRRDDEVAVLLDNENGRALTEPLVNIRFATASLVSAGTLSAEHGKAIIDTASEMHFHDRTYRNILRRALKGAKDLDTLVQALKAIDLKHEDAITLLEQLKELASATRWNETYTPLDPKHDVTDDLGSVRLADDVAADAPLMIWEFGETIEFRELLKLLALTGRMDGYARRAVARFMLDDGSVPHPDKPIRAKIPGSQDIFEDCWGDWGWGTSEEVHATLHDLGMGLHDLQERFQEEHESRVRLSSLYEAMPEPFLRALRFELLTNNLGLKREAMRYGALLALGRDVDDVTAEEEEEAKRALLGSAVSHIFVTSWKELLDLHSMSAEDASSIVKLVARARRRGLELVDHRGNGAERGSLAGVRDLAAAKFPNKSRRSIAESEGVKIANRLSKVIGVTRVAQVSELDRLGGLHVVGVYRPSAVSTTVGSGKSESLDGAIVGGVMEEIEKYCQERYKPRETRRCAYRDFDPSEAVDPRDLQLPFDSAYDPTRPIDWATATDLVTGKLFFVPTSTLVLERLPHDPLFSRRLARKVFSSNGLASGFSVAEALVHGLSEVIERHANKLAEQEVSNPGGMPGRALVPMPFVDLASCPASTRRIVDALRVGEREVRVMNITSDIKVPTFSAKVLRPADRFGVEDNWGSGWAAHPNTEFAINRAILEGVQSIVMTVSGAREDLTVRVRSLGRHERPQTGALGIWEWFTPWVPKQSFASIPSDDARSGRDEVAVIVRSLVAAGYPRVLYCDMSRDELAPAAVVRVLVPGIEGCNPLHTGERARAHAVRDLLRRHAW